MAVLIGVPARAQRRGSRGERSRCAVTETWRLRRGEGYETGGDEAQANQMPQGVLQLLQ